MLDDIELVGIMVAEGFDDFIGQRRQEGRPFYQPAGAEDVDQPDAGHGGSAFKMANPSRMRIESGRIPNRANISAAG